MDYENFVIIAINNSLTDAELGAKIRRNRQEYEAYARMMAPSWKEEGKKLRAKRKELKISRKTLGELIDTSQQVIKKLEDGKSISRRKILKKAHENGCDLIQMRRNLQSHEKTEQKTDNESTSQD